MSEVHPTIDDPDLRAGSEWLGGPAGMHIATGGFWTPIRVILLVGTATFWLGVLRTAPCLANGWSDPDRYEHLCYSDIPVIDRLRDLTDTAATGFADTDQAPGQPALVAVAILLATVLAAVGSAGTSGFYLATMLILYGCFLLALVATSRTHRTRPWDALLLALAPSILLAGTIDWSWLAVGLTSLALWFWSASRPAWAGAALGMAGAAEAYPVLIAGALLLLGLRSGRIRDWLMLAVMSIVSWTVVTLPIALTSPDRWAGAPSLFPGADSGRHLGSIWLALDIAGVRLGGAGLDGSLIHMSAIGTLVLAVLLITILTLAAPIRPRMGQVTFLVVAALLLTSPTYSPQMVLWLLPLAILARPRWRDLIWWQLAEVGYFIAVWWYLVGLTEDGKGLDQFWYAGAIGVHLLATGLLVALVVRDILAPQHDPVRFPTASTDPGGGVLETPPPGSDQAGRIGSG